MDVRPPQSYSIVTATAVAARAIQGHLPASMDAEWRAATDRARVWLQKVAPLTPKSGRASSWVCRGSAWRRPRCEPHVRALVAAQRKEAAGHSYHAWALTRT